MKPLFISFILLFIIPFGVTAQTSSYTGEVGGEKIKGTLTFKKDDTVSGSYYFVSRPDRVYKISGTNFVNGEIEAEISYAGKNVYSGTLTKTLTDSYVVWEGDFWKKNSSGENSYVILRRPR
jgi:hypothetical protein